MKQKVQIISATKCKTLNPLGDEPKKYSDLQCKMLSFEKPLEAGINWSKAENEREVYLIDKIVVYNGIEIGMSEDIVCHYDPTSDILKIGSIHEAEINQETKMAIIL